MKTMFRLGQTELISSATKLGSGEETRASPKKIGTSSSKKMDS